MKTIYEFGVRLPMGKLLDPVRELEQSISHHLSTMGYEIKPRITYLQTGVVQVEREASEEEINTMRRALQQSCEQQFGSADVEYFRRKSGNVQQSAA